MKKNIEIRGFNMKKNIEITGEIADVIESYVGIRLHICSFEGITDFFAVDTKVKEIITRMNATTKILLNVEHTFEEYMKLISDLGLEIPGKYKKHWTPKTGEDYFFINSYGELETHFIEKKDHWLDQRRYENYNTFPTRELTEKAVNLSKLGRLILLWQYTNNCVFEPDWKNHNQRKYFIKHDHINNTISYCFGITAQLDTVHFETKEQVEAFIEMYETEIKKIMEVKSQ